MDVPARLAAGERLYRDVTYNYGPAGPWLNALALRAFGNRWIVLEAVGLLLSAAILFLLFRLTARAGSPLSALVATTLAAAVCLGAPHGGAFVFPYSFANLYGLAGSLLALLGFGDVGDEGNGRSRRWSLGAAALGLALALTARPELGAATALILLLAGARSAEWRTGLRDAVLVAGAGSLAAAVVYTLAFAGIPWQILQREVPFLHLSSLPPEWNHYYRGAAGLLHPWIAVRTLAAGLLIDGLLLAAFALLPRPRRPFWIGLEILLLAAALAAWTVAVPGNNLPPVLFPLPLLAPLAATALLLHRRPLEENGRDRFLLFALAAVASSRTLLHLGVGPGMEAFASFALPGAVATACVLGLDGVAARLADPEAFRRRLAAFLLLLGGLFLIQMARTSADPRLVRLDTRAGSLRLPAGEAGAIAQTLAFLAGQARPGDTVATFPESGFFNFVTGLRNPLRENLILPGALDAAGENEVVARLDRERPRFILVCHRPTAEFGTGPFGRGYAVHLWEEVERRYEQTASFGPPPRPGRRPQWFVRAYQRIDERTAP
jgi:hypothetical protein